MSLRRTLSAVLPGLCLAPSLRADPPAIDLGGGISSLRQLGAHATVGWTRGDLYQAVRLRWSTELLPSALPAEGMADFGFLAGPYWNHSFAFASVSAGISVLTFSERVGPGQPNPDCSDWDFFCPDSIHSERNTWTVGIPVEMLFSLKLWYFGPGLRVWTNANFHRPMLGISGVAFLGGGPTRTRERRRPEE